MVDRLPTNHNHWSTLNIRVIQIVIGCVMANKYCFGRFDAANFNYYYNPKIDFLLHNLHSISNSKLVHTIHVTRYHCQTDWNNVIIIAVVMCHTCQCVIAFTEAATIDRRKYVRFECIASN